MELGVGVFGDAGVDPKTGRRITEAQAIRNIVEAIVLADQVGLGFFGVGEHHTPEVPASAAAPIWPQQLPDDKYQAGQCCNGSGR